jgi:glyceraldehyde 3-phosphate dehydrogenase
MAPLRVAINGFGRIGRLAFRALLDAPGELELVHINDAAQTSEAAAYLAAFDSVHGRCAHTITAAGPAALRVARTDGSTLDLSFSQAADPAAVDWAALRVDLVLEASGALLTRAALAPFFAAGVRKVVVSAPVKDAAAPVLNIVYGVNHELYDPAADDIVTAASCTTNCLAPVVKVIHEALAIRHGAITTVHNVTNTQAVVDAPNEKKDDLRRARAALCNLAPTSTGSATAIALIFPELKGKLNGLAIRVPLLNASITDCVFEVERATSVAEVNALLKAAAAEGPLAGILGFEERPLVSTDYINDPRSSIVDALSTQVIDGTLVKIYAWYVGVSEAFLKWCPLDFTRDSLT